MKEREELARAIERAEPILQEFSIDAFKLRDKVRACYTK